ncbi:MAG: response regulator [Planctomycetales bacterium]|nr:response regulator [bacterium]UNM06904.1 MAG: response regulator [Planctomycetales bacterium]
MSIDTHTQGLMGAVGPASITGLQHVLVVDDDPGVLRVLERTISRMEIDVRLATSGDEALAIASDHPGGFSLAILDMNIPGTSGPALVRGLRRTCPGIRIMMISGDDAIVSDTSLQDSGVDELLVKPFELSEIRERIRLLLGAALLG